MGGVSPQPYTPSWRGAEGNMGVGIGSVKETGIHGNISPHIYQLKINLFSK